MNAYIKETEKGYKQGKRNIIYANETSKQGNFEKNKVMVRDKRFTSMKINLKDYSNEEKYKKQRSFTEKTKTFFRKVKKRDKIWKSIDLQEGKNTKDKEQGIQKIE